jgi:hypothetical protein
MNGSDRSSASKTDLSRTKATTKRHAEIHL